MKFNFIISSFVILLLGAGCKNQGKTEIPEAISEEQSSEEIAIPEDDNTDQSSSDENGPLTGLYQFGDSNATWIVQVNEDGTARLWKKDNLKKVYYGSWDNVAVDDGEIWLDIEKMKELEIDKEDGNVLDFRDAFGYIVIQGKWLYLDTDACKAKDPTKRIKIKKVK